MRNIIQTLIVIAGTALICVFGQPIEEPTLIPIVPEVEAVSVTVKMEPAPVQARTIPVEPVVVEQEPLMSEEDIELIALVTMGEAEGESELGKRLVIDTILNRVDAEHLGADTVYDVIYHPGQFSCMWDGRIERCHVDEDICKLVEEELLNRTNSDVLYFHAKKYSKYGTPLLVEGNHYFSS